MHFYEILLALCDSRNIKITPLLAELDLSKGNLASWKSGAVPKGDVLLKIADYFGVSVDYLLGKENPQESDLTEKQKAALQMAEQLSEEQLKKVIDYADLIVKAENQ